MKYIYLHGFASSQYSNKAQFFKTKFAEFGIELELLDLNGEDFSTLEISQIIQELKNKYAQDKELILIGSSMGGLISLNLAETMPNIQKLILLAPALQINSLWDKIVGIENLQQWKLNGYLPVYHYYQQKYINLHYKFLVDLEQINDSSFSRQISSLIFHGTEDLTIPCRVSETYAAHNKNTILNLIDADHSLESALDDIWQSSVKFLSIV